MNQRERNDLDRHITGNWGEDSVPPEEELNEFQAIAEDIIAVHDRLVRKHDCPGYDCATCSLHQHRDEIAEIIRLARGEGQ